MTDKPNNFPREGAHNPVTRAAVDRLERERPTSNAELHYTIGGTIEADVHANLTAECEAAIDAGERALERAAQAFEAEFRNPGDKARAAYVREQKTLAEQWRSLAPDHTRNR